VDHWRRYEYAARSLGEEQTDEREEGRQEEEEVI